MPDINPKLGGNIGNRGKGRPKGVPNKTTAAAKDAIAFAADKLGGQERLAAWAQEDPKNEAVFWSSIYPKLIPLDVNHGGRITLTPEMSEWLGQR